MTGRARPAVAVVLISLIVAMLCWPTAVAALVPVANPDAVTVQKNAAATPR